LQWCQAAVKPYDLTVTNFSSCFADPRVICALVAHLSPSNLLDISQVKSNPLHYVARAIEIAQKNLNIPPLLKPQHILSKNVPDEKIIMTYVSYFPKANFKRDDNLGELMKEIKEVEKSFMNLLNSEEEEMGEDSKKHLGYLNVNQPAGGEEKIADLDAVKAEVAVLKRLAKTASDQFLLLQNKMKEYSVKLQDRSQLEANLNKALHDSEELVEMYLGLKKELETVQCNCQDMKTTVKKLKSKVARAKRLKKIQKKKQNKKEEQQQQLKEKKRRRRRKEENARRCSKRRNGVGVYCYRRKQHFVGRI